MQNLNEVHLRVLQLYNLKKKRHLYKKNSHPGVSDMVLKILHDQLMKNVAGKGFKLTCYKLHFKSDVHG